MSSEVTPEMVAEHGLDNEEYARILAALGRPPNLAACSASAASPFARTSAMNAATSVATSTAAATSASL